MASLCSLERVVRPPAYRGPLDRRKDRLPLRRGNEGAAAGKGGAEERTGRKDKPADGMARAGTDGCWRELGSGVPSVTGTGTDSPPKHPTEKVAGPNASKLSDRGWPRKRWRNRKDPTASLCSLERVVRRPGMNSEERPSDEAPNSEESAAEERDKRRASKRKCSLRKRQRTPPQQRQDPGTNQRAARPQSRYRGLNRQPWRRTKAR